MATTVFLLDFRMESDYVKWEVIQRDKLHLVTFQWEWNFSAPVLSLHGAVKTYFQALLGQLLILITFPK